VKHLLALAVLLPEKGVNHTGLFYIVSLKIAAKDYVLDNYFKTFTRILFTEKCKRLLCLLV